MGPWFAAFVQRLQDLGWTDGRTVTIDVRWAEGRSERFSEIAAEFARRKVDVIVTSGAAVVAAKQATSTIPIVFGVAIDPVGSGLVQSLAKPGGNITGLSIQSTDLAGKRIEILREVVPGIRTLAILGDADYPAAVLEMSEAAAIASKIGLGVAALEVRRPEEILPAFQALNGRADAFYVCADPLVGSNLTLINSLMLSARLPSIFGIREHVAARGLMSYGANYPDLFRRAGDLVDKILRGAKPSEIPVEQPTKFDLAINLQTAKALGLTIPDRLLAAADEVIE
jgi:putative ABC transport system substrate-binding protein